MQLKKIQHSNFKKKTKTKKPFISESTFGPTLYELHGQNSLNITLVLLKVPYGLI